MEKKGNEMKKNPEIRVWSIESVHVVLGEGKSRNEKSLRFARTLISNENKTRQVFENENWVEVTEAEFLSRVDTLRAEIVRQFSVDLLNPEKKSAKRASKPDAGKPAEVKSTEVKPEEMIKKKEETSLSD